jgi:prophage antirepressor-like protein
MNITPFQFDSHQVRVVVGSDGEPLFVGKDICLVLGYSNDSDAMKRHCKGGRETLPLQTAGGMQEVRGLSDPDVLRLIVSSTVRPK